MAFLGRMWIVLVFFFLFCMVFVVYVSFTICSTDTCENALNTSSSFESIKKLSLLKVSSFVRGLANNSLGQEALCKATLMMKKTEPTTTVAQDANTNRKLPDCLIIGARKGGTRAVQHFLSLHPNVVVLQPEVNFFGDDRKYKLGLDWYSSQMPPVAPGQVLLEKTADYFQNYAVPERVFQMNSSIKLILVVRDPVERLVSDYYFIRRYAKRMNVTDYRFLENEYSLEELLVNSTTNRIGYSYGGLYRSKYAQFMENWLKWFPLKQFHIVNGDIFSLQNPAIELQQIEKFLNLEPYTRLDDYYYDTGKGFWCLNDSGCLGDEKGHQYPQIEPTVEAKIRDFLRPMNNRFYEMVGIDFHWK